MLRWLTLCVLVLLAPLSLQQEEEATATGYTSVDNMFDCNRPGIVCYNNATCEADTGLCTCLDDYDGMGCEYSTSAINDTCAECDGAPCAIEDDGSSTCLCPQDKYGDACEYPRVSLTCNPDSMDVQVAPLTNDGNDFAGKIYVRDQAVDDGCYLAADVDMPGGFKASLGLDACGAADEADDVDGNSEVSFSVVVQYNTFIQTDSDQIFTFVCGVLQSGGDQALDLSMLESDSEKSPLKEQTVKEDLKPVSLAVVGPDGEGLAKPATIGDLVTLEYTLQGGDVYKSFKIVDLVATNGLEGDAEETLVFVEDGCVSKDAGPKGSNVVRDFTGDPESSITLQFKVFKFLRSYQVSFRTNVKLCKDDGTNSTKCDESVCDDFAGVGRRRRYVETDDEAYTEYNTTLFIYHPTVRPHIYETNYGPSPVQGDAPTVWTCLNQPGFLVLIIVLVVLLVVAFALMALCSVRAAAHSKQLVDDRGYNNKAYASS